MFEKLTHAEYWKRMILAKCTSMRQPSIPVGNFLGWDIWTMDGKAFLFKDGQVRRADWFEFCEAIRRWFR